MKESEWKCMKWKSEFAAMVLQQRTHIWSEISTPYNPNVSILFQMRTENNIESFSILAYHMTNCSIAFNSLHLQTEHWKHSLHIRSVCESMWLYLREHVKQKKIAFLDLGPWSGGEVKGQIKVKGQKMSQKEINAIKVFLSEEELQKS